MAQRWQHNSRNREAFITVIYASNQWKKTGAQKARYKKKIIHPLPLSLIAGLEHTYSLCIATFGHYTLGTLFIHYKKKVLYFQSHAFAALVYVIVGLPVLVIQFVCIDS